MRKASLPFTEILVAYSEIALKSKRVRERMEDTLIDNIRYMLARNGIPIKRVNRAHGRLFVETGEAEKGAEVISRIFGVAFSMPVIKTSTSLPDIVKASVSLARRTIGISKTFAVRARRAGTHPFTSKEVEEEVGAEILKELSERGAKVDLTQPNKIIYIEVREDHAYIGDKMFKGSGGLPLGSQGKAISLLSGDVNSAVASWLIMKRGSLVIPIYFDISPYLIEAHHQRAIKVAKLLREFVSVTDYRLIRIPIGEALSEFVEKCPKRLTCLLCKRMMYRIACKIAEQKQAAGIVTGESLDQATWRTLHNLNVLEEASTLPVLRPLIGMSRDDIRELARDIGIRRTAAVKVPRCGAISPKPASRATLREVRAAEGHVKLKELVEESIRGVEEIIL